MSIRNFITLLALPLLAACAQPGARPTSGLGQIDHIVVIYAENRSFDHLFGLFPGANGIAQATREQTTQLDHDGRPLPALPPVYSDGHADPGFPDRLPNGPFRIELPPVGRSLGEILPNPIHNFYQNREQIAGGKNDRFVATTNVGAWVMSYIDGSQLRLWQWARDYTLADNFFMAAYGGSFLNHQWLVCACTPRHEDAPASVRAQLDTNGNLILKPGDQVNVNLDGFGSETPVEVWMFSIPVKVKDLMADADGNTNGSFSTPQGIDGGAHRIVVKGRSPENDEIIIALGVEVTAIGNSSLTSKLVLPITVAVVVLFIVALTISYKFLLARLSIVACSKSH